MIIASLNSAGFRGKKKGRSFKEPVIRRFISDENIVRVTLGHAGIGDPDEFCVLVHLCNGL